MHKKLIIVAILAIFSACKNNTKMKIEDPHSVANYHQARATHLDLTLKVIFENKQLSGAAIWDINAEKEAKAILFDIGYLEIENVYDQDDQKLPFEIIGGAANSGNGLKVDISIKTTKVKIYYSTPKRHELAAALQWLEPQQTEGKEYPFLFTQSQAILARTWIPCQDGPGMRFTYNAEVIVPKGLLALMSATNPMEMSQDGIYSFTQKRPIPAYLMALAVGNLYYKQYNERSGVYAEPEIVSEAAREFEETELMIQKAEKLYGPYVWDRYDMLVLPPSFPFGGMENPMLTFATPTILAGDKSLTALIAHELAHSWSGNLVTNATWNDFWLNEGFTVYFERRIMEEMQGKAYAEMLASLGKQDLLATIESLQNKPKDTHLKLDLTNRNPDDGMNDIAYEKGYFLLRLIEEQVGRTKFDAFLKNYFTANAFTSLTTEDFLHLLKKDLLTNKEYKNLMIDTWVYGPGLPENCPTITNEKFDFVDKALISWQNGTSAANLKTENWSTHEWLHFIRSLSKNDKSIEKLTELDASFNFTNSKNAEINCAWFLVTIPARYQPAMPAVEQFLTRVGRRKFVKPLFQALINTDGLTTFAKEIYQKARPNYHSVTIQTIDEMLGFEAI